MIAIACISQLLLAALSLLLWSRLRAVSHHLRIQFAQMPGDAALAQIVADRLHYYLDEALLLEADRTGLSSLRIAYREQHDPYRTVDELLAYLVTAVDQKQLADRENLIKAFYQLQEAITLSESAFQQCLQPVLDDIRQSTFLGKPVGHVELVHHGDLLDSDTMWPLNHGTRVRQPLGIVIRAPDGKVISKAKVLCA